MHKAYSIVTDKHISDQICCSRCSSMLPPYAVFCGICGKRLEEDTSTIAIPWLWPTIVILSALATGLVIFIGQGTAVRPIIVIWFLFVCPGMTIVRFLPPGELVVQWTLAIALSCAIDAVVAGIVLYVGKWSPAGIVSILIALSLGGSIARIVVPQTR